METNEIKKFLYKKKGVLATFEKIIKGVAYYNALTEITDDNSILINFAIPVSDMGDAGFEMKMEAKLLVRWITGYKLGYE